MLSGFSHAEWFYSLYVSMLLYMHEQSMNHTCISHLSKNMLCKVTQGGALELQAQNLTQEFTSVGN